MHTRRRAVIVNDDVYGQRKKKEKKGKTKDMEGTPKRKRI